MSFKNLNNIIGWGVFLIAACVYGLTAEWTASFWDCGEFIACAYKLQVPHPPGAPLFLLIGRMFSFLAGSDVTQVAFWINMSSALSSAFTILFLYWTIVLLAKKVVFSSTETPSTSEKWSVFGAGIVGALAYTFSDSFWFSAVESEVYAMSSFFTAFVFWAMLKWEEVADQEEGADRWLILIAYLMGLSIGVHLLNLVAFPALGLIYYYKRYPSTTKGLFLTLGISGALIFFVMSGIIPGLPTLAGKVEILFVNSFGMPFGSGVIFFIIAFLSALVWGIRYSIVKEKVLLNTALLALSFILIGYASYGIIVIRSNFNTPIDENNPEDVISFVSYLKREQYGDRPLLFGPTYKSELIDQKKISPLYRKTETNYEIYDYKLDNIFDSKNNMLLPRVYSKQPGHIQAYEAWMNIPAGKKPTLGDNFAFLFKYQIGHMYWRYFMWNFAGRSGDVQDSDWLAPWESGKELPELFRNSKARNHFFLLPFLLGVLGVVFYYQRSRKGTMVLGFLFFLTGIALILYLNPPPIEPRERDYIFVGSFYAFAIWIGMGVLFLNDAMKKAIGSGVARAGISTVLCLSVPAVMCIQGWDDHDRSGRWHSVDSAKNLLNSCAKNAIVFTGGDNDTFPLWYVQEVEGFRTDVRVCNLSLLNTDWYIQQMKMKVYDSEALPISLEFKDFSNGKNDYIPFQENPQGKGGISLPVYLELVKQQHPAISMPTQNGGTITTLPSETLILPMDVAAIGQMGFVDSSKVNQIPSALVWTIGRGALEKKDLIMLDIISTNKWVRPIYFSTTLSPSNYMNLKDYMQVEGLAMRLMPYKFQGYEGGDGYPNTDIMYTNLMKNMYWRGLDDSSKFFDDNYRRFPLNSRRSFFVLTAGLINEGKTDKAKEVMNYCLKILPDAAIPYDPYCSQFVGVLLKLGERKRADQMAEIMVRRADEEMQYYRKQKIKNDYEMQSNMFIINQIVMAYKNEGLDKEAEKYNQIFSKYMNN